MVQVVSLLPGWALARPIRSDVSVGLQLRTGYRPPQNRLDQC